MTDEEDYAEYMMSGEDMSSFEMDVDSDIEGGDQNQEENQGTDQDQNGSVSASIGSQGQVPGGGGGSVLLDDVKQCKRWYDTGKAFKRENNYVEARQWFLKCRVNPIWWFKALKQLIKCDLAEGLSFQDDLEQLFRVVLAHQDVIGTQGYIYDSIARMINRLVPDLKSQLFFPQKQERFLQQDVLSVFQWLEIGVRELGLHGLQELVAIRKMVYSVWICVSRGEQIPERTLHALYGTVHLETYFVLMQLHLRQFVEENVVDIKSLVAVTSEIGRFMSGSLSVSQIPTITSVYHFARFLVFWKGSEHHDEAQVLSKCEDELILCFQDLETIGGREGHGLMLSQLCLVGIVLCHLLLSDEDKVAPFELEQIKVLESNELVISLRELYQQFLKMDLFALEDCLSRLKPSYSPWYDPMVTQLISLCQSNKLWKQIAPTYSCISLQDLISKLKTETTSVSMDRDRLLTLLMKSIAKDTAAVYYKLDLVEDYIYFGDEFQVPLRSEEYDIANPSTTQRTGSEVLRKDEWLCNVSNWHKAKIPRKPSAMQFMDAMKAARIDTTQSQSHLDHHDSATNIFLLKLSALTYAQTCAPEHQQQQQQQQNPHSSSTVTTNDQSR